MEYLIHLGLIIFTIFQRLLELRLSQKNTQYLISIGAKVINEKAYLVMVSLHATWLACILILTIKGYTNYTSFSFSIFLIAFICGQILRLLAIYTLKHRWTTRIVVLPEAPIVKQGIFKWIRHPNYLGVCLEIFALPWMGQLYFLGLIYGLLNFIVLYYRIRLEEESLIQMNPSDPPFSRTLFGN